MATRIDPIRNFRFAVLVDGKTYSFSEVTVGDSTTDAIDYRVGDDPTYLRKLSGLSKFGNITLKWGTTNALDLYKWHADTVSTGSTNNRKTVTISLLDETNKEAARFVASNAWPVKYTPGAFNAKGNDVMIETLELAHETLERAM